MSVPKVAIVGRPNVGKSSLFNWIVRRRVSIVDPTAGVTRDRVTVVVNEGERYFELIDTGGIGVVDSDALEAEIERQIEIGLNVADLILFVVDAKAGRTALDVDVAERLRRLAAPKILVVNKCDGERTKAEAPEFFGLTDGPAALTSIHGNHGRDDLIDTILDRLPPAEEDEAAEGAALVAEPELKLAIVGRRNAGKSTFINALAEEERVIVSEVEGTTRDSVDVRFDVDGKTLIAIDTAGVRKRKSLAGDVEFYSLVRAKESIRRADVTLMFFDATKTISRVDKQLVDELIERHKPCVFVVNKWDLGLEAEMTSEKWIDYLASSFPTLRYVPIAFLTAKDSKNIRVVVNLAQSIFKQTRLRIGTGKLNEVVRDAIDRKQPPFKGNRRPKIYFATQVSTEPPTIVLKCNDPKLFSADWTRYLLSVLRERLPFPEVPIRLVFRAREQSDGKDG
ncbi:MAG: ribosome biogenesis GTPase Der [Planctomycetaceae bacterium]